MNNTKEPLLDYSHGKVKMRTNNKKFPHFVTFSTDHKNVNRKYRFSLAQL